MDKATARNDLTTAVPKFCLALEEHRRTPDGRVRTSQELLTHYFPHDGAQSTDRLFKFMPNDVRGPILAAWGIRGAKAALRDDDAKVQSVIHDALVAGDLDHAGFEEGLTADTVVRWSPLSDFWTFWRGGKLSKNAIQKALVTAYELSLFDAKWFLDTIDSRGGKLKGTDVLAEGLAKDDLIAWLRKVHESGDGSPRGLLAALGWDTIVAKTTNDVLIAMLDAMVIKVGLMKAAEGAAPTTNAGGGSIASPAKSIPPAAGLTPAAPAVAAPVVPAADAAPKGPSAISVPPADIDWNEPDHKSQRATSAPAEVENMPTVSQSGDAQLAPAPVPNVASPPSAEGDEDIVVDDDVDLNDTGVGMVPREDPPTSPRMLAAQPVEPDEEPPPANTKSGKGMSKRPEPAVPPRSPSRQR